MSKFNPDMSKYAAPKKKAVEKPAVKVETPAVAENEAVEVETVPAPKKTTEKKAETAKKKAADKPVEEKRRDQKRITLPFDSINYAFVKDASWQKHMSMTEYLNWLCEQERKRTKWQEPK